MNSPLNLLAGSVVLLMPLAAESSSAVAAEPGGGTRVYIGTYTGAKSKGIYVSTLDAATGKLSAPELAAEVASPSFLAIHPSRELLYAVSEVSTFQGKKSGAVTAFAI